MINKILEYNWQDCWLFQEANNFLPKVVIDTHTHCSPPMGEVPLINSHALTPGDSFNYFPLWLHREIFSKMFPGIEYRQVSFGFPHLYGREQLSNSYLLSQSFGANNLIPVALYHLQMHPRQNHLQNFSGLKMYRSHHKTKQETKIVDIFPEEILQMVDSIKGNIILHLPESILENIDELMMLSKKYSNVRFILAHMGVIYLDSPLYPAVLKELTRRSNIYMDTAMVSDVGVFLDALKYLGHQKILFGSDAPFSFINGNFFLDENKKIRLKSDEDFIWVKKHYTAGDAPWPSNLFHYRTIVALKQAIMEFDGSTKSEFIKNDIFFENALRIFS